ncbi:hypothetical protein AFERRID_28270 [Acidithiobacillus ferridurans]|uniref:Autotransporter domain-containing protein n=2 Tax=Acidithiobacillus ferridurans TaxID=1232575 RepID=A0A2Z6IM57_ACIFI|nr:hypothetical protein AFERRID_28270 [Acidithiobacillus ferridurans]
MTGVNQELWYTHLSADYAFGSPINGGGITGTLAGGSGTGSAHVSGHSMAFNARIGKLFAIGEDAAVGPYLAYQYADFKLGLDGITARYQNNAVQLHTLCPECEHHDQRYSWHRGDGLPLLTVSIFQHTSVLRGAFLLPIGSWLLQLNRSALASAAVALVERFFSRCPRTDRSASASLRSCTNVHRYHPRLKAGLRVSRLTRWRPPVGYFRELASSPHPAGKASSGPLAPTL